jgi:hypothetical protein
LGSSARQVPINDLEEQGVQVRDIPGDSIHLPSMREILKNLLNPKS